VYLLINVLFTGYFQRSMARLAGVLRHFAHFATWNSGESAVVQRITGNAAGAPRTQLHLQYALARDNCAQLR
jgi:hypothetical protein